MQQPMCKLWFVLIAMALAGSVAKGQPCAPVWTERPPTGVVFGRQQAMISWDPDGEGPAKAVLVAGCNSRGDTSASLKSWSGERWTTVADSPSCLITTFTEFDDGRGPALYIAGGFATFAGQTARSIVRWDGTTFTPLGSGLDGLVSDLLVYDDGGGPALWACGSFTSAGKIPTPTGIAKWDGDSWIAIAGDLDEGSSRVENMAVYDDGTGPSLYITGYFKQAGGQPAKSLAKRVGETWVPVGGGISNSGGFAGQGYLLRAFKNRLYVSGEFTQAGTVAAEGFASWDGTSWQGSSQLHQGVYSMEVLDVGEGPELFIGGSFSISAGGQPSWHCVRWDGSTFLGMPPSRAGDVWALAAHDDGSGLAIYAAVENASIDRWTPGGWSRLGSGFDATTNAGIEWRGDLYVAGAFAFIGNVGAHAVARLTNTGWDGVGYRPEFGGSGATALALATGDIGEGDSLYAGGTFGKLGGVTASKVARWDGASWWPLGSGANGTVRALAVFDDGNGPALYAGGEFTTMGGGTARRIARWNGSVWQEVGGGISGGTAPRVYALTVHDDGTGPALYAAGLFTSAGGAPAQRIARWDGHSWSQVGPGIISASQNAGVYALASVPSESGPLLYAGGDFYSFAPDVRALARWDGTSWTGVHLPGLPTQGEVRALTHHDGSAGTGLYVGGRFSDSAQSIYCIARFDGGAWTSVGAGVGSGSNKIWGIAPQRRRGADGLWIFGDFLDAGGEQAERIARWSCPESPPCAADIDQDGSVDFTDYLLFLNAYDSGDVHADIVKDGSIDFSDYLEFLNLYDAGC